MARVQLGQFWLAWRSDGKNWSICWNDTEANTRRRVSLNVRDYNGGTPPLEAQQQLAEHFSRHGKVVAGETFDLSNNLNNWLLKEGYKREAYGYAVAALQRWIKHEGGLTLEDLGPEATKRLLQFRLAEGVVANTVKTNDLIALKRSITWAWENRLIPNVPFIGRIDKRELHSSKHALELTQEQVAKALEEMISSEDTEHLFLFTMIMLSTHSRVEAVLEAESSQIDFGKQLFNFNAAGRMQTIKRRAIVPIVPTLQPWLEGLEGKVILYKKQRKDGTYLVRQSRNVIKAFRSSLKRAGIEGGYPNCLRHTCHTFLHSYGVPQAQIDMAAGHSEPGSGRHYNHLRPEYLEEFVEGVEAYWTGMDRYTSVHRRTRGGPGFHAWRELSA
ncbi:MAG: tyrosine-type recombinase/integrase [Parasphingorhabdus sp.]